MHDDLTDEENRIREGSRALIEEYRREHDERIMSEITVSTYFRASRQTMLTPPGKDLFRGSENYREETPKDTGVYPREIEEAWVRSLRIGLIPSPEPDFEGTVL